MNTIVDKFEISGLHFKALVDENVDVCTSIDLYAVFENGAPDLKFAEIDLDHEDKQIHLILEGEKVDRYNYDFWKDNPVAFAREVAEYSLV